MRMVFHHRNQRKAKAESVLPNERVSSAWFILSYDSTGWAWWRYWMIGWCWF